MKARDLMTPDPVTIGSETAVQDIARLLVTPRINGLPVVDTTGRLLGLVTEGDLIHRAADETFEPPVVEGQHPVGMISRFDLVRRLAEQADSFNPLAE